MLRNRAIVSIISMFALIFRLRGSWSLILKCVFEGGFLDIAGCGLLSAGV